MRDELVAQNAMKEYLADMGVEVSSDLAEFNTNKSGYVKVDKKIAGRVDSVLQQLPVMINKAVYCGNGDVYRVVYDKGLGVLQKSAKYPGQLLGNVVSASANNKIKDVARLQELAVGPQINNGVFTAMSMVTGQYFMAQINHNLKDIEANIESIRKFLEDDKRSKLQSEEDFLNMTQNSLNFIMQNESQKQSTICSIQKIRIDSLASINFYRMQINDLKDLSAKKDKAGEVIKNIQRICFMISEYWYSLYLYCYALYLEPIVAENYDSDYIDMVKQDMKDKCEQYKADYTKWKKMMDEYIVTAKAFETNKILGVLKTVGRNKVYMDASVYLVQTLVGVTANVAEKVDKKAKKEKKDAAIDSMNLGSIGENMIAIECKQDELDLFNILHNGRLEIVKDHEDLYIKVPVYEGGCVSEAVNI